MAEQAWDTYHEIVVRKGLEVFRREFGQEPDPDLGYIERAVVAALREAICTVVEDMY